MDFYMFLENGHKINIADPIGHLDPALFWIESGQLMSESPSMGRLTRSDLSRERLNAHIKNMIAENLTITIQ